VSEGQKTRSALPLPCMQHPCATISDGCKCVWGKKNVYLFTPFDPSWHSVFIFLLRFCCKFACRCACVASISRGARSLGLMCQRLNGSADSPMQHDSVSSNLISKCARQQAASYKSKYHPSLCFRLQFINRWHLCVPAAVLQKSHGPLLRRISLLVITFARGLFRLLHAGLKN
jgi:hypothetical protein